MEYLAPTLKLTMFVRFEIKQGVSLYDSLQNFCRAENGDLVRDLKIWLCKYGQGESQIEITKASEYRKTLFHLFEDGLNGLSVYERLQQLEELMIEECKRNIQEMATLLPYKALLPLMFFMFPALLILLLTPIFYEFQEVLL